MCWNASRNEQDECKTIWTTALMSNRCQNILQWAIQLKFAWDFWQNYNFPLSPIKTQLYRFYDVLSSFCRNFSPKNFNQFWSLNAFTNAVAVSSALCALSRTIRMICHRHCSHLWFPFFFLRIHFHRSHFLTNFISNHFSIFFVSIRFAFLLIKLSLCSLFFPLFSFFFAFAIIFVLSLESNSSIEFGIYISKKEEEENKKKKIWKTQLQMIFKRYYEQCTGEWVWDKERSWYFFLLFLSRRLLIMFTFVSGW